MNTEYFDSWEIECFCISGKKHDAFCLICRNTIHIPKCYNINCHYKIHHTEVSKNDSLPSKLREKKLVEFKKGIFFLKIQSMLRFINKNKHTTNTSYEVTHISQTYETIFGCCTNNKLYENSCNYFVL